MSQADSIGGCRRALYSQSMLVDGFPVASFDKRRPIWEHLAYRQVPRWHEDQTNGDRRREQGLLILLVTPRI